MQICILQLILALYMVLNQNFLQAGTINTLRSKMCLKRVFLEGVKLSQLQVTVGTKIACTTLADGCYLKNLYEDLSFTIE